jgi:hypothetical protein
VLAPSGDQNQFLHVNINPGGRANLFLKLLTPLPDPPDEPLDSGLTGLNLTIEATDDVTGEVFRDFAGQTFTVFDPAPAPEPSTLALAGVGVVGLLGCVWRKRRKAAVP